MKFQLFNFLCISVLFFAVNTSADENETKREKYKVVIVGAGVSGIAAAAELLEKNVTDILILEASDRIGGRIYTAPFGDFLIEYGAQWIHGQEKNPVYEIAEKYNVTYPQNFVNYNILHKSPSSKIDVTNYLEHFFTVLKYYTDDNKDLEVCNCSIHNYIDNRLNKYVKEQGIDKYTSESLKDSVLKIIGKYEGTQDLDKSGTWGTAQFLPLNGSFTVAWKSGYISFIDMLIGRYDNDELPVINKTRFNKVVEKIDWSKADIDLLCEDGSHFYADHVIVTVSLGVLKHSAETMFKPSLPERKLSAIKSFGFDLVGKIFIQFETRWWPLDFNYQMEFLWSNEDKELYKNQSKHGDWATEIVDFHFIENQPRVLEGWVLGDTARKMEQLSEKEVTDAIMELLHWFMGDKFNISQPINLTKSSWYSNKFVRGSYSFHTVDSDHKGYLRTDISQPILNNNSIPIVMFAGEATHDYFFSTVHGALESGWREAERILKLKK